MLSVTYKKMGIKLTHIYFAMESEIESNEFKSEADGDIIFLHGASSKPINGMLHSHQYSLVKDLSDSEEEIYQTFGKHLRKQIRQCEKNESVKLVFYSPDEILKRKEVLEICAALYSKLFSDKGMKMEFNVKLAQTYAKNNCLEVIIAFCNDSPIGFTSLIYDDLHARAWCGAFDFRNSENDGQTISRAHRLLNWKRMVWCRNRGIKYFDFGGISSLKEPNNIDLFKMDFASGGEVEYNNYLIPNSFIGEIAMIAYKAIHKSH